MGQNNNLSPEANGFEAEAEREKIDQILQFLKALDILAGSLGALATADEVKSAEGRRCILSITGLSHHKAAFFFEVNGGKIHQVQLFEGFNTYIGAPIDCVIRVLKGVLDGDETAFSKEWARGQAKIIGLHSVHDGLQFAEAFGRLARLIKRYRTLTARA